MLSVILPVLNEGENLKILIPALGRYLKKGQYEIIVVDDDSRDSTASVMAALKKKYRLTYLLRKRKKGLSSAVIDGFRKARGDRLFVMDSDLSHPPPVIARMVRQLDFCDIVIASRYVKGGGVARWPLARKAVSLFATLLSRPLVRIKDPLAGYFGLRRDVIKGVKLNPIGFKILLEILVKGRYKKAVEIPYTFQERKAGKSKANTRIYVQYNIHLLELYFYKLKNFIKGFVS